MKHQLASQFEEDQRQKVLFNKMNKSAVPSALGVSLIAKEGFMQKQSPSLLANWQRRWFSVSTHYLKYHSVNPEHDVEVEKRTLRGTINLYFLDTVEVVDPKNFEFHVNATKVSASGGTVTKLRCANVDEMNDWIAAIQAASEKWVAKKAAEAGAAAVAEEEVGADITTDMGRESTCEEAGKNKVLMVLTSNDKLGDTGEMTGWYLPEAAHPHSVFTAAGIEMAWASPKGGCAPLDASSVDEKDTTCTSFASDDDKKVLWTQTLPLAGLTGADYDAVFFVGGFGTMWDFPENIDVQRLSREIYEAGGVISAVCHGPCALVNVTLSNGELLVKGKAVSAFTNEEEDAVKRRDVVPWTNEDKLAEAGATFVKVAAWGECVSVAGRLVTGQNPASAKATAEAVVAALRQENENAAE